MIKIIKNSPMIQYTIDAFVRAYLSILFLKITSNITGEIISLILFPFFWIYILNPISEKLDNFLNAVDRN